MIPYLPRIGVVGGGPSGLALAKLLHQRGFPATVHELRSKPTQQELDRPSGVLDLHEESGLKVVRECGLWHGFQAAVGDCSECMRVMNSRGDLLHTDEGQLESRPEIARNALADLFLQHLPLDTIEWNQKIRSIHSSRRSSGATEITLDLGENGRAVYDFVVGADGAWSKVRKLLSDVQPFYSGAQYITATIRNASSRYPQLCDITGSGTLCALGGGNGIMTQRGPQDSIRLYAAVSTPHEQWAAVAGLAGKTASEVATKLLRDDGPFTTWAPALQQLLFRACEEETKDNLGCEADIKPYYMLPVGHRWHQRTGVTLIGDSSHLMLPWAGEGVNVALWDALDLADVLTRTSEAEDAVSWQAAMDPHLRKFGEAMFTRAEEKAEESLQNKNTFLSEGGGEAMANFFKVLEDQAAATDPIQGH